MLVNDGTQRGAVFRALLNIALQHTLKLLNGAVICHEDMFSQEIIMTLYVNEAGTKCNSTRLLQYVELIIQNERVSRRIEIAFNDSS